MLAIVIDLIDFNRQPSVQSIAAHNSRVQIRCMLLPAVESAVERSVVIAVVVA